MTRFGKEEEEEECGVSVQFRLFRTRQWMEIRERRKKGVADADQTSLLLVRQREITWKKQTRVLSDV